jgi:hypothetical protein
MTLKNTVTQHSLPQNYDIQNNDTGHVNKIFLLWMNES